MIRSRTHQSDNVLDALSISGDIVVLQGSTSQTYYAGTKEWDSDRRYVPCILYGAVFTSDPAGSSGIMNGEQPLTGIEWYTDVPTGDYTTHRISNPSQQTLEAVDTQAEPAAWRNVDYLISDGSNAPWCSGVPQWGLIIHKNIPHNTTISLYAVLKFLDKRSGTTVSKIATMPFATEYFDNISLRVEGNRPGDWIMDPVAFPEPASSGHGILDESWIRTFSAQLRDGNDNVPDAEACYLWTTKGGNDAVGWRELSADELSVLGIANAKVREIHVDARMVKGELPLRCYAKKRTSGAAWSDPRNVNNPFWECRMRVKIGENVSVVTTQTAGFDQGPQMNSLCRYTASILYNGKALASNKSELFRIIWVGANMKTGTEMIIGEGSVLTFLPKAYGFQFPEGFSVRAEAYELDGCSACVDDGSDSIIIVDDDDDGTIIIDGDYI